MTERSHRLVHYVNEQLRTECVSVSVLMHTVIHGQPFKDVRKKSLLVARCQSVRSLASKYTQISNRIEFIILFFSFAFFFLQANFPTITQFMCDLFYLIF